MSGAADTVKLSQLVEELYAKKKWLDRVIAGLEAAIASPDYRLIQALTEAFENGGKRPPKVDLRKLQQTRLEQLAADVSRRKNGVVQKRISTAQDEIGASGNE